MLGTLVILKGIIMATILNEIANKTKQRVADNKITRPLALVRDIALDMAGSDGIDKSHPEAFRFNKALRQDKINFITEVKKASPSKGIIAEDFPYLQIAMDYEKAGAAAISCLTEPFYFKGSDEYLREITSNVSIPVIRKDFTVDEYMIYEAKELGASAVLLICSILSKSQLSEYMEIAHSLGLSALVETHDEDEVAMALDAKSKIIGVNNRNLKDFTVDINNSIRLRQLVPSEITFVSESGMKTADDIGALANNGTNAVLIGETLMRASNKKEKLDELRSKVF